MRKMPSNFVEFPPLVGSIHVRREEEEEEDEATPLGGKEI